QARGEVSRCERQSHTSDGHAVSPRGACGGARPPPRGGGAPPWGGGPPPRGGGVPPLGGGAPPLGGGVPPLGTGVPPLGGGVPARHSTLTVRKLPGFDLSVVLSSFWSASTTALTIPPTC